MKTRKYCAIIGDINKSRRLENRNKIQNDFQKAIDRINREFKRDIASKFLITLGDEFQGLLLSPRESYFLIRRFQELMEPVGFAFGIGIGTISTSFKKVTTTMDGDVFHRARKALEASKKQRRTLLFDFDHPSLTVTNVLAGLIHNQWLQLTPKQRRIAELMKHHQNQTQVAKILSISQPSVWKVVRSTNLDVLHEAEVLLARFLATLLPN